MACSNSGKGNHRVILCKKGLQKTIAKRLFVKAAVQAGITALRRGMGDGVLIKRQKQVTDSFTRDEVLRKYGSLPESA